MSRPRASGRAAGAALLAWALGWAAVGAPAAAGGEAAGYRLLEGLMAEERRTRREAAAALVAAGERAFVPPLVDALFFIPGERRREAVQALERLTGERRGSRYLEWVEYVGGAGIEPPAGYAAWKRGLLERIDPRYNAIFYDGAPARIRLEEIVWGGVRLDGIPSLDDPAVVAAGEAGYLGDGERVFGVLLGGEARAYPLRILDWHEMLNDVVGGEPVTLSYCTLCGSGILYATRTPAGGAYRFGTSGLLYRSNKLMYDRQTFSLWSNLTGRAVVGRAAGGDRRLEMLPMTLTTWGEWRRRHPETTALALDRETERRWGFRYQPGAADRARRGVAFPVWARDDRLERQAEVYALELGGVAKAYPLESVARLGVVNDELGGEPLVLVADRDSGAVRAYRRGERTFAAADGPDRLVDAAGAGWRATEGALEPVEPAADRQPLERLPGHVAFWFGWYGFHPDTELFDG